MIGGLQGENGDLDIKNLKQNIQKCRLQISGNFRRNFVALCKMAAKLFRKTELSSPGCKVGFHLEVSSSLLAAWFVHRQKEKHLTVQKCCEILATKG